MQYLWLQNIKKPSYGALDKSIETDVLVIGGGMAGVLCARLLHDQGLDCVLVEGTQLGTGITKGTTAVLTPQHDTLYQEMIKKHGKSKAQLYLRANLEAIEHYRQYAKRIDCDFEERPSVMYTLDDRTKMEREAAVVRSLGFEAVFQSQPSLPFPVLGAVAYPGMAQFHPLKFLYGIALGLQIYENTFVEKLEKTTAVTAHGTIRANRVIIATHFPFVNRYGLYFLKLCQRRSYVIALKNGPDLGCTIEQDQENGMFLRNYRDLLLVGGGGHRTGKKGGGFDTPRAFAKRYFPKASEVYAWANQDCVSVDGVPYIGSYSPCFNNVFVATGFHLWGMTSSMVATRLLTDQLMGRENPYAQVFQPKRPMLSGKLLENIGTTLLDFLTPTLKRCPHLGCALKWNPAEHSWDCPCHGSRFDEDGTLIENPAMRDSHVR